MCDDDPKYVYYLEHELFGGQGTAILGIFDSLEFARNAYQHTVTPRHFRYSSGITRIYEVAINFVGASTCVHAWQTNITTDIERTQRK